MGEGSHIKALIPWCSHPINTGGRELGVSGVTAPGHTAYCRPEVGSPSATDGAILMQGQGCGHYLLSLYQAGCPQPAFSGLPPPGALQAVSPDFCCNTSIFAPLSVCVLRKAWNCF